MIISVTVNAVYCHRRGVKRIPPDTAIHEQNGSVNYKNFIMTNVDNNDDTKYTNKHKDTKYNVRDLHE